MCLIWETCGLLRQTGPKVQKMRNHGGPFLFYALNKLSHCTRMFFCYFYTQVFFPQLFQWSPCHPFFALGHCGICKRRQQWFVRSPFLLLSRHGQKREEASQNLHNGSVPSSLFPLLPFCAHHKIKKCRE